MSAIVWGLLFASQARALPAGGQVSAGAAAIQQPTLGQTAPTLTVNQSSQNAAINWQSFGIGANEAVRFNQPNANSITLNRVTGQDPSQILGKLTANGQIFLLNPNGILFGQGAQVNAGGIVASTLGMSDADFMAGNYSLANGGSAGVVVNEGEITVTAGGYVALIGTQVTNVGKIKAPDGSVALAAGDRVTLTFADGGLAGLNVDIGTLNALVANKGAIIAGKQVILTAKAIDQISKSVVNNTGIIEAAGINEHNGVITLAGDNVTNAGKIIANKTYITASNNAILTDDSKISAQGTGSSVAITGGVTGAANIGGTIDAAAKRANQAGGQVFITAGMVAIDSSTLIDVSGPAGGGTINIGGGLHGGGALAHAMAVTIASRATMNADATGNGDGGVIAIWSDGTSQVSGALSAKGGALGGNGGIIETSGHVLDTTGISIDASAPLGASGTWLLDPTNLTVTTSATTGTTASPNFTSNVTTTSNVLNTAINTALTSSNVVLTTTGGNVTISAPISKTGATATTLTVNASGNITIGSSSAISASGGALNVTLDADNSGSGAGSGGSVSIGSSISTNGGNIIIGGQNAPLTAAAVGTSAIGVNVAAALSAGGGNITINGTGYNSSNSSAYGINVTAALSTTGNGTITLKGTGAGSGYNEWGVYASANITTATGAISITGTSGASATQSGNHGVVLLGATTSTSSNGTITITGTAQGSATTGASRGVLVTSGAVVTSGGLISVTGTNSSTDNGGTEYGVYVTGTGSTIKSTGTGGVTVIGTGGGSGSGATNYGVFWDVASGIQSTSTGAISITGTGGDSGGTGTNNYGVYFTTALTGSGAAISMTGTGGNSSGTGNDGIYQGAAITNTGTGAITLSGTGGGTGTGEIGYYSSTNVTSSGGGNISITGKASSTSTGSGDNGINLAGGTISTTGSGTVTLAGTAYGTSTGSATYGVYVSAGSVVTAANGLVQVTGTNNSTGTGAGNDGVYVTGTGSAISSSGTGGVTVIGYGGGTTGGNNYGVAWNVANAIQSSSTGAIGITGTGGGGATDTGGNNYGVTVGGALSITGTAPLTIVGTGGGAGGGGANNFGVDIGGAIASGGGAISVTGTGGNSTGGLDIGIVGAAALSNTGAGTITLNGQGAGSAGNEIGVYSSANITAATGAINITGLASATGAGLGNHGVSFVSGAVSTGGAGTITIAGTGSGISSGGTAFGVDVSTASITAANGLISITGRSNSTGTSGANYGVYITGSGATVDSTGTGGVTILGFGGGGGGSAGGTNYGVFWDVANGIQSTSTGPISITGTGGDSGGSGTGNNGVNTTYAISSGGGAISITGTAGTSSGTNYGINVASVAAGTGTITLTSTSANNAIAALTGGSLNLLGSGGVFILTNASNAVTTLAGNTGAVTYSQTGALTIGTVGSSAGLSTTSGTALSVATAGALTIASSSTVSGASPTLAATGAFINNGGSSAVTATSGRWLIYSANSTGDTFGSLNSNNAAVWNTAAGAAVTPAGNRYVFANQPTLTITTNNLSKVYGVNNAAAVTADYTITGLQSVTNAYADTAAAVYSGTPTVTSSGSAATATVAGSTYAINATVGSLSSLDGYALAYANTGLLTVTAAPLTVTASTQSRVYGNTGATLALGTGQTTQFTTTGLLNSDSVTSVTLTGTAASTAATTSVGTLTGAITPSVAAGTGVGNYNITYVAGNATITQAALTVTASNQSRVYGNTGATLALGTGQTTQFTTTGLLNSDSVTSVTLTGNAASTAATTPVGTLTGVITPSVAAGTGVGNYNITYVAGNATITQAALTVIATNQSRVYGTTSYVLGSAQTTGFTTTGLVNSDSVSSVTLTGTATATNAATGVGTLTGAITPSLAAGTGLGNYTITYMAGNAAITQAALTVTATNQSRIYGPTSYVLGNTQTTQFTTSGLVNTDSVSSVTLTGTATATNATTSVGTLNGAITASGAVGSGLSNYTISYAAGNATVTAAPLTVTASAQSRVYGPTSYVLGASQTTQFTTSGLVNSDSVSSVTLTGTAAATNAATGVGTLTGAITASGAAGAGLSNYTISYAAGNATITQAALTVTAANQSRVYGPTSYVLGSTQTTQFTTSGLVNTDSVSSVTLTGTAVATNAATGVGTLNGAITASGASGSGLSNYTISYAAGNASITAAPLTVTASNQTRVYGPTSYVLGSQTTGFTTSGLVNSDSVSSVTLTGTAAATNAATGVGTLTGAITASAASGTGLGNYTISYVAGNAAITQAALTVTASNQSRVYGPTSYAFGSQTTQFTTSGLVNSDSVSSVTLTGTAASTAATTGVGTLTGAITASGASGSGLSNYAITYAAGNATITQAALTVTASNQSRVYGPTSYALGSQTTQFTTSGLVNSDSVSSVTLTGTASATNAATGVGTLTGAIAASAAVGAGLGNYTISYVAGNATIAQAALTVTASNQSRVYGPTSYALGSQTTGFTTGGLVNSDSVSSVTLTGTAASTAATTGIGTLTGAITASAAVGAGLGNYTISYVAGNATIAQAALTVTANAQSRGYGAANPALTYSTNGLVNGDTLSGSLTTSATATSNVGPYAITQGSLAASSNYALTYNGANLTITQAALTVTASNQTRVYGPTSYALGSQTTGFTVNGLVNSDSVASVTLAGTASATNAATGVGTLSGAITASGASGAGLGNYTISYVAGNATITQAALTVTADAQSRVYGAANPALTYTQTGLVNGDTLSGSLATSATTASGVGTYGITQGGLTASSNYALTYNGANLTVTQAALTVTANAQSRTYGSVNPTLTYTTAGLVNGDTLSGALTTTATTASGIGTYGITQGGLTASSNYALTYNGANLAVTQAALTVRANAQSRGYGSANPALTYSANGLVNGDTLTGSLATTATTASGVGSYAITQGSLAASGNYAVSYNGANLTVTAAPLTVTASNQSRVYGPTLYALGSQTTGFTTSGLVNSDSVSSVTLTGTASATNAATGVGTLTGAIAASAAVGAGLGNYTISYVAGNATIAQAALTVTASNQSRVYGPTSYALGSQTTGFTTGGLVNSDSVSSVTLTGTAASTAATTGIGTLTGAITASAAVGAGLGNYTISYVAGNATIAQAALTVTANAQSRGYGAANPALTYSTNGLVNGDTLSGSLTTSATTASGVGTYGITQGGLTASSNYALTYNGANLTVTAAPLTITASNQSRVYGPTLYALGSQTTGFTTSGLVNSDSVTSVTLTGTAAATNAATGVGTLTVAITASGAAGTGLGNYTISYVAGNATITAAPLTITAGSLSKTYGATVSFAGTEFTASGLQNNETVGSASLSSAGAVATAGVGSSPYGIGVSSATGGTFNPANYNISYVGGTLTVNPAPLTVTASTQSRAYGAANPTLTYTATGLVNNDTLSGALTTTTMATSSVAGSPYAITQGTLTSANNPNYAITYNGANLTVTPAALTVTADAQSRAYGSANPVLTYTTTGLVNNDTLTGSLTTSATTASPVGTYAITQGTLTSANNPNYAITYNGANLTVTPAALTVTADAQSRAYGSANPALTYTATGLVNGDTLSGTLTTTAATASPVGAYPITIGSVNNPNYTVNYTGANLTVTAAPLTITASNQNRVYGPTSYAVGSQTTQFTTSGLVNSDSVSSVTLTGTAAATNAATGVGTLTGAITASAASGTGLGNYTISYVAGNAAITQAVLTVTADAQSRAYGSVNPTLTYTTTGLVNSDTLTGSLTTTATTASGVGSYAITQGSLVASANYALTYNSANLTVTQAALTVTADAQSRGYGSANPALTYSTTGLVNNDTLTGSLTTTATTASSVASYAITQGSLAASANYVLTYNSANLTVTQAALTVTADAQSRAYGSANPALTYSTTGLVNNDTLTGSLTTSATTASGVGSYAITQGSLAASGNYAVSYNGANLMVTQAALTVTASNQSRVYGAVNPALTYSANGLVNGDALTGSLTTTATTASGVGTYGITQGGLTASSNYALTYNGANLTVTQAALTVTADTQSRVYGSSNPALTYTTTGLVNNDTLTGSLTTSATTASPIGTYAITQGTLTSANNPNYAVTYIGANLTVNTATATVTANAQSRAYGAANPTLTYTASGLVNGDTLTGNLTTTATTASPVGAYPITIGSVNNPNYTVNYTGANLTVTAAPLTITANAQSRAYGAANPSLTYMQTGLVNGDTLSGALSTSATTASGVGTYAITQGGLTASSNYAITYNGANLTIEQAALTITADAQSRTYGAANPSLTYTAIGLVNNDILSGSLATSATMASPVANSPYTITQGTLTSANNPNYAITYVGANLTVTPASLTVTASNQSRVYGPATYALGSQTTGFTTSGLVNSDSVSSVTLTGTAAATAAATGVGTLTGAITASGAAGSGLSNYTITYVAGNAAITQAALTVTAGAQSRAYGVANPALTYTATGLVNGDTLTGALTTTATTVSSVGTYAITQGGLTASSNYAVTYNGANLTVTQAALTVTASAQSRVYGAANPALTYTQTGLVNGDTLTGALTTTATTASPIGPYAITQGSLAASANYALTYNGANLTVTQAALTVTANAQSRTYGAANPTLTYTTTGLVNGDTLGGALTTTATTTSSVGSYGIVQGSLAASSNYALTYNGANLTVTQAALTVTANAQSRAYGAANPTLTYTTTGLVNGDTLGGALTTTATTASGVGTYGITQGGLTASSNYALTYNGANLTVTQAALTVTANAQSRAYGAANPTLTYTTTGLVNGDTLGGALTTTATTASGVGTYGITQGGLTASSNYAVTYNGANLTVTQAALTVTANAQSRAYGAANPTLTYTTTGLVNGDTLGGALTTTATTASGVGTYGITQGGLTASSNYAVTYNGANLTVTQAALTVTANAQSRAYGAANPTLTYTTTGLVNGDTLTGALTTTATATSSVANSPYAITQGGLTASSNYALTYNGANLTITQAALTVTADAQSRTYGAANPSLTYTATGLVNGDTLTGVLTTTATATSSVAGLPYAITQGTLTSANNPNYAITYVGANLTVTQAALTVTANAQSRTYGAANPTLTYTTTGLVNGDTLGGALTTTATTVSSVGSYAIAQGTLAASSNYALTYNGANLTITQAALTVTADAQSRAYGAANPTLTYTTAGLVNGDTLTGALTTTATTVSSVGSYAIAQGTLAASSNYALTYNGANLTITQAALTVTADAQSRAYGAANPTLTYTTAGLVNGDTLTGELTTTATAISNVGTYGITQGTLGNANYTVSYTGANLTVTQAALTVTADAQSRAYGSANPVLTYTTTGLVNGDTLSGALTTSATTSSPVGTYAITQGTLTGANNPNYAISYIGANLTVNTATATVFVTANAQSRAYGAANPTLTYTATGLVNGDTLTGNLTTTATTASPVGAYPITIGSVNNPNYTINYTGANLTVTAAPLTITANAASRAYGVANLALTYSASGLVNGDMLSGSLATSATATSNVGSYAITQGTLGNTNYAITYNGANLTVTQAALTVTANAQSRAYGAANPVLTYTQTGLVNGDTLTGSLTTSASRSSSVGSYGITQGSLAASANYAVTYNGANLTITQAALTVTADAQSRAYGAVNPILTYSTNGLVNSDILSGSLTTSAGTSSNVGSYAITQGTLATSSNYMLTYNGANLTITQAPLTVTANNQSRVYGPASYALGSQTTGFTTSGLVNSDSVSSVTLTGTAAATSAPTGVGTLTGAITASGASGTGLSNYLISYVAGNASIIQAALTVTANAQSRTYGATNPALTYTTTGLVNNDTLTGSLTTTATTASSVGNYAITQGSLAASSNYAVTYNGANLTITQAALTVTANAQSRVYGATNPALTYTQTGLVNGDTLSGILTTTATPSSSVGSYAITQGTLTASSNYAVTYNSANLTVTAAPLTITADAQSRAYGAANPALTYTQTGLVAGDSLTGSLTTSATTESSTGTYPIMIGSLNNPNYTITYNGADLAITAAPQTVAASAAMAAAVATVVTVSTNVAVSRYAVTQGDQLGSSSYSSGIVNTALTIQPVGQITLINNGINIPGDLTPSASVGTINTQIKKSLATTNDSASITAGTQ